MRKAQQHIIAIAGLLLIVDTAHADINDQCVQSWVTAASAEAVGKKCNWLNAGATQKLKASQDRAYTCSIAKATEAEKSDFQTVRVPKARDWVAKNFTNAPCDAKAKQFFDAQVEH
jgi:hypothetical protein